VRPPDAFVMNATWSLVISIAVGIALLFFGRFLYWIYIGVIGFALGFALGAAVTGTSTGWIEVVIGLAVGVVAAFLSVVVQKPLAAVAGFVVAGGAAVLLANAWVEDPDTTLLVVVFVLVGILGAILAWVLFEPALIIFTSLSGAGIITSAIDRKAGIDPLWLTVLLAAIAVLGMVVQSVLLARRRASSERPA
jgi:hypothetical protein